MEDAKAYTERYKLERIVTQQSGHVPVPISIVEKPGEQPTQIADGSALWTKPKGEISTADYVDFYRSVASQYDEPALTVHYRAEGRQEYTALAFVPGTRPFDLFDPDRKGRMKLYVKRVFITDDAELLPRYLRFMRGIVDSADLPLNVSREMIQESPILAAIRRRRHRPHPRRPGEAGRKRRRGLRQAVGQFRHGAEGRHLRGIRTPRAVAQAVALQDHRIGRRSGARSATMSARSRRTRRRSTTSPATMSPGWRPRRSSKVFGRAASRCCCSAIRSTVSGFPTPPDYEGKPFKSVTQGAADLAAIPLVDASAEPARDQRRGRGLPLVREGNAWRAASPTSAPRSAWSRARSAWWPRRRSRPAVREAAGAAGRLDNAAKPILEINPRHELVVALAALGEDQQSFREDFGASAARRGAHPRRGAAVGRQGFLAALGAGDVEGCRRQAGNAQAVGEGEGEGGMRSPSDRRN